MTALAPSDLAAIVANAGADARTALAMLLGAHLESGADPAAQGGGAYGVWQLQGNPRGADTAYAASVMEPRYAAAAATVPDALWTSDPVKAAETAAYRAERPAKDYYASQGAGRVTAAYVWAQQALGGTPSSSTPSSSSSGSGGTIKIGPVDTGIPDAAGMTHYLILGLGVLAGLALVVMGAQRATDAHPLDAAKKAAGKAALVA